MYFSFTDQAAIIAAVGETVTVDGSASVTADVRVNGILATMNDGSVETTGPLIRFTNADVATYSIDHGTEITMRGVDYTVVERLQEQTGLWLCRLVKTASLIAVDDNDDILLDDGTEIPSI